jgi:DNA-binding MarR family transcriptional regulator
VNDAPFIPAWMTELKLAPASFTVLAKLWRHRGRRPPFEVWPTRAEILRCVPINKDTLSAALNDLESRGLIERMPTWKAGRKTVVFSLRAPGTIVRNGGEIVAGQSSESKGLGSSETEGATSSETEGRGSNTGSETVKCVETHDTRPVEDHLEEIQARWPNHDVRVAYRKALRHVRQKRGNDATLTAHWFETEWMPREAERPKATASRSATIAAPRQDAEDFHDGNLAAWKGKPEPSKDANGGLDWACWREANPTAEDAA